MNAAITGIVNLVFWTSQQVVLMGKNFSAPTVKNWLRSANFSWRRVRKSMKKQRDGGMFDFFKKEIEYLRKEADEGLIRLWFYDESGFNLNPNAVYAWLPPQKQATDIYLPAQRGNVLTVAGFLATDNTLETYSIKGPLDSLAFIAFVDDFVRIHLNHAPVKNIAIIDNASFHKSAIVKKAMERWKAKNLFFQFIPPYCSELNRIEILWYRVKHNWLEIQDYASAEQLEQAVLNIFRNYRSKYLITFN